MNKPKTTNKPTGDVNRRTGPTAGYVLKRLVGGSLHFFRSLTPQGYFFLGTALVLLGMYWLAVDAYANPFAITASIMLALFFVSAVAGYVSMLKLSIGRRFPAGIHAGDRIDIALRVRNRKRFFPSGAIRLTEHCGAFLRNGEVFHLLASPGETIESWYHVFARRRGVFVFERTKISSTFPLGLFRNFGAADVPGEITVWPAIGRIDDGFYSEAEELLRRSRRARFCSEPEDFRSLRDYRRGDSLRAIHWKASARRDDLIVREYERNEDRTITVILDCRVDGVFYKSKDWEQAISFVATLALDTVRRDYRLKFFAFQPGVASASVSATDDRSEANGGPYEVIREIIDPSGRKTAFLDRLARIKPCSAKRFADLLSRLPHQGRSESLILFIGPNRSDTELPELSNIRRLAPNDEAFSNIFTPRLSAMELSDVESKPPRSEDKPTMSEKEDSGSEPDAPSPNEVLAGAAD
ncbi:MAG: DUF58 domain-containing protein [Planctomycetota bacterium]